MSMNFFYKAYPAGLLSSQSDEQIDALVSQHPAKDEVCLETAWDVLREALQGCGFASERQIDQAMYNGCMLINAELVAAQAKLFGFWDEDRLIAALGDVSEDAYHADVWLEETSQPQLLGHFRDLKAFFSRAADAGYEVLLYPA